MRSHFYTETMPRFSLFVIMVKVQFRGSELFKKKRHYFMKNLPTFYIYAFMNKLVIWMWMDCLNLNVILMFLLIWFCHTAVIESTWQPVQNQHLVVMLCNVWLAESSRASALWSHDHNIETKTWWSCWSLEVDLVCLWKFAIKVQR